MELVFNGRGFDFYDFQQIYSQFDKLFQRGSLSYFEKSVVYVIVLFWLFKNPTSAYSGIFDIK